MAANGYSTYPQGFSAGIVLRNVPITQTNPGKVFWVSNSTTLQTGQRGGSNGNKGTYDSPFSTVTYAFTQCVANRGDIIFVKPGHTETVTDATTAAWSIAGVTVIGLGNGLSRPTFTFTTANTATILVSAANVSVMNCVFVANFLSISSAFTLTTAKDFTVQACLFQDTSGILNFLNIVKSTGAANTVDGLTVTDSQWTSLGTTSVNSFVLSANDIDRAVISRNLVGMVTTVDAAIFATITAGVVTNIWAESNYGYRKNTTTANSSFISVGGTTSTGWLANNKIQTLTTTTDKLFTTTVGLAAFNNLVTGVVGASGFLIPAADS